MNAEKQIILKIFRFVIDFLDSHNIEYFMADGSAIGTVRHKGFIPWDDDIDIYMLRSEYNKLIDCSDEFGSKGYKLINLSNTDNYYLRYSKIVDTNTTLWEVKKYPCIMGAFIDIFPLDYCDNGIISCNGKHKRYIELMRNYLPYIEKHTIKDYIQASCQGRFFDAVRWVYTLFTHCRKRKVLDDLLEYERTLDDGNGSLLVNYTEFGLYAYPKEWFSDYIMMSFEGLQVKMPIGYHEYLTYMYGDYMKLPPENERISYHYHLFYNIEKALSINEVKKLIK